MAQYFSKSVLLLAFSVVICCVMYPLVLWGIGQTVFPFQANGSMLQGPDGTLVGSQLIAQPFTKDEYFQPRPSAASYDASASASSSLAASNYLLRDRVARTLGPLVQYRSGPKAGQPVASDIEAWFQQDQYQGVPHIVAQWATLHNGVAQAWVTGDPSHSQYVDSWVQTHADVVVEWIKANPSTPEPKAADLAVVFFEHFSNEYPGKFPAAVSRAGADGISQSALEPVAEGTDIQAIFFDMWRQDHADTALQDVPGDLVTTSGSGLDPHITLENAIFQLERVASAWAEATKGDPATIRTAIARLLQEHAAAPLGGLAGEKLINVLEVNLALRTQYGAPR